MDKTDRLDPKIEAVFRRILASAQDTGADKLEAWKKPERDLRRLAKRDYVRALRRNIGYRELKTRLVGRARRPSRGWAAIGYVGARSRRCASRR